MNHLNSACCNKMDFERKCRVVGIKIRHTISNCLLFLLHINLLEFIRACKLFRNTHVFTMYYKPKKQPWQKNKHGLRIVVFQENTHLPHEIWIKRNRQQQSNDDDKKNTTCMTMTMHVKTYTTIMPKNQEEGRQETIRKKCRFLPVIDFRCCRSDIAPRIFCW